MTKQESNKVPEEFKEFELKGNNFAETRPLSKKLKIGGSVLIDSKQKTTFERVVLKNDPVLQFIKSILIHSEFHKELKLMFCEYLVDMRLRTSDKSFEEECKINPTKEEWARGVEYRHRRVLKIINFSHNFKNCKTVQIDIPPKISNKDRIRLYFLTGSPEYWEEETDENIMGPIHQEMDEIWKKYIKEGEKKEQIKLDKENKRGIKNKEIAKKSFENRWPNIKIKIDELNRRAGLLN